MEFLFGISFLDVYSVLKFFFNCFYSFSVVVLLFMGIDFRIFKMNVINKFYELLSLCKGYYREI